MSDDQFPALRFDPAVGNVGTVQTLAKQMHDTGVYAKTALDTVDGIKNDSEVWTGKAAHGFTEKLGELPKYLDKAHQSLQKAGKALNTWTDQLQQHQQRARELEKQAKQAIGHAEQADKATKQAQAKNVPQTYDPSDDAAAEEARRQTRDNEEAVTRAQNDAQDAWDKVEDIRRKAQQLQERWDDDGKTCAKALNDAGAIAPDKGFWESVGDVFKWIGKHIGDIASIVSSIAGVLCFIPGAAAIFGPIALAAGAVVLGADATKMAMDPKKLSSPTNWIGLGGDVLGVIPGVGSAMKGVSTGVRSATKEVGLTKAVVKGSKEFKTAEPAKVFQKIGNKSAENIGGNADAIAKSTHIGTSLVSPAGSMTNLIDGDQRLADTTGTAGSATTSAGTISDTGKIVRDIGEGGGMMKSSLSAFSRALG